MTSSVYMQFEYTDLMGKSAPKVFENPIEVLSTDDLQEVKEIFDRVEKRLNEGYYVAGYVSYEAAPAFDQAFSVHSHPEWPLVWFGVFDGFQTEYQKGIGPFEVGGWELQGDYASYQKGIEEVKAGIGRGDTYQVNFTTRMTTAFSGDDYTFYRKLVKNQQGPYSAYLNMGERRILSASPELFFRIDGKRLTTKPMKGTAGRGRSFEEDTERLKHLRSSAKEQSENLMIVDLLRNDLGKIVLPGSVHVPSLFEVETYPTVHQMTSTVEGELPQSYTMFELFKALFPCGSITGAPKVRTMEYIERLEDTPREVYCGAVGYMTPEKDAVFNVPIRTVMVDHQNNRATYGTGGGITWDSTTKGEYEELKTKARLLTEERPTFQLLETMKLENGSIPLLKGHLNRVVESASYFGIPVKRRVLEEKCLQAAASCPQGLYKVRMLVDESSAVELQVKPVSLGKNRVTGIVSANPLDEGNFFLFHKTTFRDVYQQHQSKKAQATLLWNQKEELTEFTIANLVVKSDGKFYTPPVHVGLLPGVFREDLLRSGRVEEKVLFKKDLYSFDEIWMVNALRGWVRVDLLDNP